MIDICDQLIVMCVFAIAIYTVAFITNIIINFIKKHI